MKVYCDCTNEPGCVGVLLGREIEVVFTGTQLHIEAAKYRTLPLALRLAQECDLHFWFSDEQPELPFYTVPKTEVFAHDSRGGFFVTTEHAALDWSAPLYYIDPMLVCHRIPPTGKTVADMGSTWRETMVPWGELEAFPNRAAAEARYPILTLQQLMEAEP